MPNGENQFVDALMNFSHLVIPNTLNVSGVSRAAAHPTSITGIVTPFLVLVILNCASFILLKLVAKLFIRLLDLTASLLNLALTQACKLLPAGARASIHRAYRTLPFSKKKTKRSFAGRRPKTTSNIGADTWEKVKSNEEGARPLHDDYSEVTEALRTLGLKASATQKEIRGAYIALMKQFHPDLYTTASLEEQKKIRAAALEIRHAYDTIVKQHNQVH